MCACIPFASAWRCDALDTCTLRTQAHLNVLRCVAVCCSVLQSVAVCCSVLQCGAVWCWVLQRDARLAHQAHPTHIHAKSKQASHTCTSDTQDMLMSHTCKPHAHAFLSRMHASHTCMPHTRECLTQIHASHTCKPLAHASLLHTTHAHVTHMNASLICMPRTHACLSHVNASHARMLHTHACLSLSRGQVAVCCSVLQCVAVCCSVCSVMRCVAVCCSALQCVAVCAVCCSVLQNVAECCRVLQSVAVCCSVLQQGNHTHPRLILSRMRAAVCCSVWQCVAVCCVLHMLQCVAVCCSVMQLQSVAASKSHASTPHPIERGAAPKLAATRASSALWHNFSNVSSAVVLLSKLRSTQILENFYLVKCGALVHSAEKFSKVWLLRNVLCAMTVNRTFENL